MAVSDAYLSKIRFALRRQKESSLDAELADIVEQCRQDMQGRGVASATAGDETNALVLGCMRAFARWQSELGDEERAANREDYLMMVDQLRKTDV